MGYAASEVTVFFVGSTESLVDASTPMGMARTTRTGNATVEVVVEPLRLLV